jgi:hypothetical protein
MLTGICLLLIGFYLGPLNPASLAYCIFLSGILVIIGYRFGFVRFLLVLLAYLFLQHFWIEAYLPLLQLESQLLRTLLYSLGSGYLFYGMCRYYSSDRALIHLLITFAAALASSLFAIKIYVFLHPHIDLGDGLILFIIGFFTFVSVLFLGFIVSAVP